MNRMRFAILVAFSVVNSALVASIPIDGQVSSLVGAQCMTPCTTTPQNVGECLHLGQFDPCSLITCIQNTFYKPSCPTVASGGVSCPIVWGHNAMVQTLYDQPCSGTSGWAVQILQAAGPCQSPVGGNFRCLNSCGSGTGYGASPRDGWICSP